jgi:hypothetical protein
VPNPPPPPRAQRHARVCSGPLAPEDEDS